MTPVHSNRNSLGLRSAAVLLGAAFALAGCMQDSGDDEGQTSKAERRLFVFTTTFGQSSKGVLLSYDPDSSRRGPDSLQVYSDCKVVAAGQSLYLLERWGADNLIQYDPRSRRVVYQEHLGDHVNPSDMLVRADGTAVIALQDSEKLLVVDIATGKVKSSIDLGVYAHIPDSASNRTGYSPHAFALALAGDSLLVGLQRRHVDFMQKGSPSIVVILDAKTLVVRDTLQAPAYNAAALWVDDSGIFFGCQGGYDSIGDGGLYRWSRGTGNFKVLFTETELGGNLNDIACNEKSDCLVSAYDLAFKTHLHPFSSETGRIGTEIAGLESPTGGLMWEPRQGHFIVGERSNSKPGLVRLGIDGKRVGDLLPTPLPPANFGLYPL